MKSQLMAVGLITCCWAAMIHGEPALGDATFDWDVWREIVVLDDGRTKPLDTYGWETAYAIAGRSKVSPSLFASINLADIVDWTALAKALSSSQPDAEPIASLMPKDLLERLGSTDFDIADTKEEVLDLWKQLERRRVDFSVKTGLAKTMRQFRSEAKDLEDRALIRTFDEAVAKIDAVGTVQSELLASLNERLPMANLVPKEFLTRIAGGDDVSKLSRSQVCLAHRRYLESVFPDMIRPLPESELASTASRFEDRKYDPVEFVLTLALSWRGWDDPKATAAVLNDPATGAVRLDQTYWSLAKPDVWDDLPMINARYGPLRGKLVPETETAVSARAMGANEFFLQWAMRVNQLVGDKERKADVTTLEHKTADAFNSYQSYIRLRIGEDIRLGPDNHVRPKIEFVQGQMAALAEALEGSTAENRKKLVEDWKDSLRTANGAVAQRLSEVADQLLEEWKAQEYAENPASLSELIDRRTETLVSDIGNEVEWVSLADILLRPERLSDQGYDETTAKSLQSQLLNVRAALVAGDAATFNASSKEFATTLQSLGKQSWIYPSEEEIQRELHYNRLQPFLYTAVLSGIALIILVLSLGLQSRIPFLIGLATLLTGVGFMVYGLALRVMISGRPPVTNMYETILWASLITAALSFIMAAAYRHRIIVVAAAMALTPATILAYVIPPQYGASITPLVAVLRDNFWLIIHVLTIVASYGAFMLSWMLGNIGLAYYLFGKESSPSIKPLMVYIYVSILTGAFLLVTGTILGGWWAAYSWGRFWGNDPKEVAAAVAFLIYIFVLHLRLFGAVKTFGMMVASVLAFGGVVMSWYGVNFLLGAGLHAYAFGDGGQPYVLSAALINIGYVAIVAAVHYARKQAKRRESSPSRTKAPAAVG